MPIDQYLNVDVTAQHREQYYPLENGLNIQLVVAVILKRAFDE